MTETQLREALRIFMGAAYPVAPEINPRGYNWSEAYLDQAREHAQELLAGGARVLSGQVPPYISVPDFDDRTEERVCINGCLYLRADFAARRFGGENS